MKIIIVTLYKGSFPFIDELMLELNKKGIDVSVFDMIDMLTVKVENGKRGIDYHTNAFIRRICGIRFLGTLLRIIFYKIYLRRSDFSCDHINIHYALPYYTYFVKYFKKRSNSLSVVIWGSDFYRVSDNKRYKMKSLFDSSDSIIISNTQLARSFGSFYKNDITEKIKSVRFGIGKLEIIKELLEKSSIDLLRRDLNLPTNKLIITIGYNGIPAQQHMLILNSLSRLKEELKKNMFLLIPFGYGGNKEYKDQIINEIKTLNIPYQIYDSFISDIDVAKLRVCTDLVINAQTSDASSASLQEHLYARNVLLVGDWLEYDHFSDAGVKFWRFSEGNLGEILAEVLGSFEEFKSKVDVNNNLIYQMSNWSSMVNQWIKVFENKI